MKTETEAKQNPRRIDEIDRRAEKDECRAHEANKGEEAVDRKTMIVNIRTDEECRRMEEANKNAKDGHGRAKEENKRAEQAEKRAEQAKRSAEEAERRAGEEHQRANRADSRATRADRRAQEADSIAQKADQRAEEAERRAEEFKRRAVEEHERANEAGRRVEKADTIALETNRRALEADIRAQEAERRAQEAERRAKEADIRVEEADRRAEEANRRVKEADRRAEEEHRRADKAERRAEETDGIAAEANRRAEEADRRAREAHQRADQLRRSYDSQWVVRREEIDLTGPEIGRGGWATVSIAQFRGVQVAVKRIHNQIICRRNQELFSREMQMAARLRHPNLVQFIGATVEGDMMILMEYMPTSLRRQLEKDIYFQPNIVKYVSLDIAKALNYLHQMQPDPMIHRDISSANVLLEPLIPPKYWKAKITDYGSVNLIRQLNTENPGSPAYSAPEANAPSLQSPKMDIYSFGVLILEMLTGQLQVPENRTSLFHQVHHEPLLRLIQRCLTETPGDRPSASVIISELS